MPWWSFLALAHAAPPTFQLVPIDTPDGPGVATAWFDAGGQPIGAVGAVGALGISDGWLKWLRSPTPEIPPEGWSAASELVCVDGIVYDAGDGFSGTETELCDVAAADALWTVQVALLADHGIVGQEALATADLATRQVLAVLGAP